MHRGKYQTKKAPGVGILAYVLLVVTVLILLPKPIDSVMAYMFKQTETVTNTLDKADVSVDVNETFTDNVKSNVYITNNGEIPVYIRVTLVEYWKKGDAFVAKPDGGNVTITWADGGWLNRDGVYYYPSVVAVGDRTQNLISEVTATLPEGYTYHLDIHAEAIQAEPADAVIDSWHVTLDGSGNIQLP